MFGQRPYDEVRIDEIAERAGVSRALMYHYFPDKRAFFGAVVRAEGERLFEATSTTGEPGQSLFGQLRDGVLAYLRYDEEHPHGAWAAYMGLGRTDPVLRGEDDVDNDRQADRIMGRIGDAVSEPLDATVERDLRATVYGWLALTFEMCRNGSRTPRSTRVSSPTVAHTRCSTPSAECPDCPTNWPVRPVPNTAETRLSVCRGKMAR